MKSGHNIRQDQPIVNATDGTSDALFRARTPAQPVCTAADRPTANSGEGGVNARRSSRGRWCSMAVLIAFATAVYTLSKAKSCTTSGKLKKGQLILIALIIGLTIAPIISATDYEVIGAGTEACNGIYVEDGTHNGKAKYVCGSYTLFYLDHDHCWCIHDELFIPWVDETHYFVWSSSDTPPSSGWQVGWMGWSDPPAPTVQEAAPAGTYIPPDPENLVNATGNYWVNYTWQAGAGNVTDSYNVNMNGTWTNGTTATFLNTTIGAGNWANITVWAYNASGTGTLSAGCVSDNVQAPSAPAAAPNITSSAPPTPVNNTAGATRTFNITIDQTVNVTWYINGTNVQDTNTSVAASNYTNTSAEVGVWNVSAVVENANGTDMQEWVWTVSETTPPAITIDAPTPSSPANRTGGEQFWVNFTYTELYPVNYTVTVGNATAVINSTTNPSVVGGTDRIANESFYLNASAADGWYNVTVEMYDNSSNYNITHQNHSVAKGFYDASISQPENQTTEPDVNATYTLTITNTGSFAGTFALAVTNHNSADVAAMNMTEIANIASGASQNVTLNVTDASAGTYNVTVNVTSNDSGSEVAETGYVMTTVVGPTLTLDNVNNIASDWGRNFSVNHSVTVTNATASNVNVTYNVSWIDECAFGTVNKDVTDWCNHSIKNSTVRNLMVKVDATTTTGSAINDTGTFSILITRRNITVTADPESEQTVGVGETFWINGSAKDEHNEAFFAEADLIRDGSIIDNKILTDGNANFSTNESAAGTSNFSIRFHNTTHYNNASTSNSTVTVRGPTLTLDNVTGLTSDWGRNFSVNHSVTVTNATASNVNVTYNVSWIDECAFGTVNKDVTDWCNHSIKNSTVQNLMVKVDATTTTGSAINDTGTFLVNITRREIIISSQPPASQTVNPNTTFWINASASDEHRDKLIGFADLIRDGSIIDNKIITGGNANFSRTEPAEGAFNFSIRFYNTSHYNNKTTSNATVRIVDNTPPASITDLDNPTTEQSRIHWTWTDPTDIDFAEVMIYLDGTFKTNVSKGVRNYNATGLAPDTEYMIGTHTVDDKGNVNQTWVNDTARTLPFSGLQRINVTPTAWTLNINESRSFNATGFDNNNDSIDNLVFAWYTTPSGIGTLNTTTGSVVNFTARHAGRTEIYAVNGSVSSNETYKVWITVNAPPKTEDIGNGTGNATSGNSTATVRLNNRSVNGTITIEEIGDPINGTEDIGNRTGLGTDSESVKGANVTVNGSIVAALNDTGGYVHIRIEYNESQLGDIDENTLHIYKFVNGTGWVRLVAGNPPYCIANGRDMIANYVWVNVTECSIFLLAGTGAVTPTPSGGSSGGDGTYPPGWFGTPAPAVTATKAPAPSANAMATPPGERVTPAPTKRPAAAKAAAPAAEGSTAEAAKKSAPGFTSVFVIAGMLAVAYAMMRRRG